ncbi:hypothetical protein HCN44_009544 [Aphidius gifuensis]|uniref:Uncharacterized protein n=1 Tax=Aphidius gifuensis TaxID=684658 RepID=A0A834Y7V5_APHGI|nr:uncharacterized protein LOC122860316 [Aphidius gifuensis]KAF7998146.1 hypothetical protein HCN44_009544 [Aphidius gifuensis]
MRISIIYHQKDKVFSRKKNCYLTMLKLLMLACLCSALFVNGIKIKSRGFSGLLSEDKFTESMHSNKHTRAARQAPGSGPMPEGEISMDHGNFPGIPKDQEAEFNHPNMQRRTRQAPGSGPVPPGGMTGGQGNLGMQGLGNIPDPTAWVQKGQEVMSQMARGRRQAPSQQQPRNG